MMTSEVIQKQRLLHENEIMQLLHNYKCYGVDQTRFRKPLKSSVKTRSFLLVIQFVANL